ncbi:MAG: hypothetical protein Tsb0010_09330 [Parvularculaceae bacterium]
MRLAFILAAAVLAAYSIGLAGFVADLPRAQSIDRAALDGRDAGGVAVLTGGRGARIAAGAALLRADPSRRLLITGVGDISEEQLRDLLQLEPALFACCIDIDRAAKNTSGNAKEIAAWAAEHGFDRVIVVTSDYHLPRSLAEIRRQAPMLTTIPHPVASDAALDAGWWRRPRALRLLAAEYAKFLFVRMTG